MADVFLGIGSNIERERHIIAGLDAVSELCGSVATSSVYDGAAIGFAGAPFLNLVVRVQTELPLGELARRLRQLEFAHGRPANATRNSPRQLDIDILTYGDRVGVVEGVVLPRPEILINAFVLRPLAELAPQERHPQLGQTYGALWAAYDQRSQALWPVAFSWRGRALPVR
jgi:2-amino-4-hydroxy-6-hydroxymethyldihydropteridine diphosphokinase